MCLPQVNYLTKERFCQKKTQKTPQPLALFCLAYPMATVVFAFVNGSSQTIACGPLRYSCCIAALQNLLQSNSAGREIKGRMGWRRGVGGWEKGGRTRGRVVFSLHHIPTHHNLQQHRLVLIHFRRSRSSPAKHLFNPKKTFNNTGSGTRTAQLMAH